MQSDIHQQLHSDSLMSEHQMDLFMRSVQLQAHQVERKNRDRMMVTVFGQSMVGSETHNELSIALPSLPKATELDRLSLFSPPKSSELDPLPPFLIQESIDILLPFLTTVYSAAPLFPKESYRLRRSAP